MPKKHQIDTLQRLRESLAYRMGLQLKHLHAGLTAAIDERLRADGMELTRPQALTLMLLAERPGASNAELARLAGVSPQTMHQILRRLDRDALVTRAPHPTRARSLSLQITAEGLARVTRGAALAQTVIESALDRLQPAEQTQLVTLLERCAAGLPAGEDP
ncbi:MULTISPECIES: MarR family transcriptional regulator [Luteimonas]|uniref:MarR family transcriptional regulator n=1 Tax=Luteimonas chenhongjianii TaxID=2006110 RepID=A0A290XFJ6_9GAMM|nr:MULTISPECIES: MarR family transcriptional regulator [Luteimonas]ATD67934.1 MarR family transcriptional regulator [Luteimonas chenhongjianii]RPD88404.1 MarR family transcriptional regulator [Luteimonas sp. 100069]